VRGAAAPKQRFHSEHSEIISTVLTALLVLQAFHVLFLALHDWVPVPPLNDVKAVHAANPSGKLLLATLTSTVPYAFLFAASLHDAARGFPTWLWGCLWGFYAFLFVGELEAWWIPYFFGPKPERAARYKIMFGRTHAFLPLRYGVIRPNTLHVILHLTTVTVLVLLAMLTW
jgi:hypothetical protein